MPGQMGNKRVTVQGIQVHKVVPDKNLLLIRGAVPGAPDSYVTIKLAAKRQDRPFELIEPKVTNDAEQTSAGDEQGAGS